MNSRCTCNPYERSLTSCLGVDVFALQELEADVVALMAKRVYDVAGVLGKGCKVTITHAYTSRLVVPTVLSQEHTLQKKMMFTSPYFALP